MKGIDSLRLGVAIFLGFVLVIAAMGAFCMLLHDKPERWPRTGDPLSNMEDYPYLVYEGKLLAVQVSVGTGGWCQLLLTVENGSVIWMYGQKYRGQDLLIPISVTVQVWRERGHDNEILIVPVGD